MSGIGSNNGWMEAAIAWEVCASLHRQYCKGKDDLFTTRRSDFVKHAENARRLASRGQTPAGAAQAAPVDAAVQQESPYDRGFRHGYNRRDAEVKGALA